MRAPAARHRAILLSMSLLARPAEPAPPGKEAAPRLEELTKSQYGALAESSPILVDAQRTTKGEIRAKALRRRDTDVAALLAESRKEAARYECEHREAIERAQAPLAAQALDPNAPAPPRNPPASALVEAVRKEAEQLAERARKASPAELEAIDRRAGELLLQLQDPR
jgi:hypothetical protein